MYTMEQRCQRAVKNPRLIAFIICCGLLPVILATTALLDNVDLIRIVLWGCPLMIDSFWSAYGLSALVIMLFDIRNEAAADVCLILTAMVPILLCVASAILGTVVKKQWHLMAIILLCADIFFSLISVRIIAVLLDLALLILLCTTSSSADFWKE